MAFKKNRPIKVYETSGTDYKRIPQIRLQGKWLQELGFDIGEVPLWMILMPGRYWHF